jgi:type II secretory pathway pseudopilin PulG
MSDAKLDSDKDNGDAMNRINLSSIRLARQATDLVPSKLTQRGFDRIELVVVIIICVGVLGVIMPVIQNARERSRRMNCANNLKQIGLGLHNYHDAQKTFPGSAEVIKSDPERPVGGWSFLYKILPHLDCATNYSSKGPEPRISKLTTLPSDASEQLIIPLTSAGIESSSGKLDNSMRYSRDVLINEFLCPSNPNPHFENPNGELGTRHAFTNYKAMCSVFAVGFMDADQYLGTPKANSVYHGMKSCDGGLYPTNRGIRINDLSDGTSHTILCAETMDYSASSWIAGSDVNIVAIPTTIPPQSTDVTPAKWNDSYYVLAGPSKYNGQFYEYGISRDLATFFSMEFGPSGKCAGLYELDPLAPPCQIGTRSGSSQGKQFQYGPSSGHPKVINCLFGDGGVRGVRRDVDAQALFFAVTRNNNDPAGR